MPLNPEFTTALRAVHGAGKILRKGFTAAKEYRFSSIVFGIVKSVPFQMKVKTPVGPDPGAVTARARPSEP